MQLWLTRNYVDQAGLESQEFTYLYTPDTGMKSSDHHAWLEPKFFKLEKTLPKYLKASFDKEDQASRAPLLQRSPLLPCPEEEPQKLPLSWSQGPRQVFFLFF